MRVFSTFSGIGGFEIGIHNAWLRTQGQRESTETQAGDPQGQSEQLPELGLQGLAFVGYSEIDKYASSVYEKQFKGVKNYGDITKINAAELPDFDCLVGGFPCQAFSIAGKRHGFEDTRGTLFFDLARILRAKQPRLFVFENVKGLLSHDNGKTFTTIIAAIDELGYDAQWQVLNSKNHGVPQNRERIIIVGHLRGQPRPKVFPFTVSSGETAQKPGEKGEIVDLTRRERKGYRTRSDNRAGTLDANYYKGIANQERPGVKINVVGSLDDETWSKRNESIRRVYGTDGLAPTIPTGTGGGVMPKVLVPDGREYVDGKRVISHHESDTVPTIRATHYKSGDNQPKILVPEATKKGYAEATVGDAINLNQPNSKTRRGRVSKVSPTLDTKMDIHTLTPDVRIRRLTPLECERLQGFPDNWTKFNANGEPVSDTQRYKMCGNAVTTNVIQAVFEKIFATT